MREPPVDRAPVAPEIGEDADRLSAEVIRLDAVRCKHARRKAALDPQPVFPTEPDAA